VDFSYYSVQRTGESLYAEIVYKPDCHHGMQKIDLVLSPRREGDSNLALCEEGIQCIKGAMKDILWMESTANKSSHSVPMKPSPRVNGWGITFGTDGPSFGKLQYWCGHNNKQKALDLVACVGGFHSLYKVPEGLLINSRNKDEEPGVIKTDSWMSMVATAKRYNLVEFWKGRYPNVDLWEEK